MNGSTVERLGGTGVGGLAGDGGAGWGGRGASIVNGQVKMDIGREINVAYERFPSFLSPEWLQRTGERREKGRQLAVISL